MEKDFANPKRPADTCQNVTTGLPGSGEYQTAVAGDCASSHCAPHGSVSDDRQRPLPLNFFTIENPQFKLKNMKPVEIRPWRKSPFKVGQSYCVRRDFKSLRDSFRAGEVLVYQSDAWSRYDGYTGYLFAQPGTEQKRVWDIHDDEHPDAWLGVFEEVQPETKPAGS